MVLTNVKQYSLIDTEYEAFSVTAPVPPVRQSFQCYYS